MATWMHNSEVALVTRRFAEIQAKNVRCDTENFQLEMKLVDAQQGVQRLEQQLAEANESAQRWRAQCEEQLYGTNATVVKDTYQSEFDELRDQIDALQHMNTELRL